MPKAPGSYRMTNAQLLAALATTTGLLKLHELAQVQFELNQKAQNAMSDTTVRQLIEPAGTVTAMASEVAVAATGEIGSQIDIAGKAASAGSFRILVTASIAADKTAQIALEDTVNNFTAARTLAVINLKGALTAKEFIINAADIPNNRFGTASAELRLNCLSLDGTAGLVVSASLIE